MQLHVLKKWKKRYLNVPRQSTGTKNPYTDAVLYNMDKVLDHQILD